MNGLIFVLSNSDPGAETANRSCRPLDGEIFISAALSNLARGWYPIPVGRVEVGEDPPKFKKPWLKGLSGRQAHTPTEAEIRSWPSKVAYRQDHGALGILSLGIRCPSTAIGLDVDHYGGKHGADQLRALEGDLGPLPRAPRVTARDFDSGSGIRLLSVPDGWTGRANATRDIEIIQTHHRYLVAPPSSHYTGNRYRFYRGDGRAVQTGALPKLAQLPALPDRWLEALQRSATAGGCESGITLADFAETYTTGVQPRPGQLKGLKDIYAHQSWKTGSRHHGMRAALTRGFEEVLAKEVDAAPVLETLTPLWKYSPSEFERLAEDVLKYLDVDGSASTVES